MTVCLDRWLHETERLMRTRGGGVLSDAGWRKVQNWGEDSIISRRGDKVCMQRLEKVGGGQQRRVLSPDLVQLIAGGKDMQWSPQDWWEGVHIDPRLGEWHESFSPGGWGVVAARPWMAGRYRVPALSLREALGILQRGGTVFCDGRKHTL